jgi:hypothetical protein
MDPEGDARREVIARSARKIRRTGLARRKSDCSRAAPQKAVAVGSASSPVGAPALFVSAPMSEAAQNALL